MAATHKAEIEQARRKRPEKLDAYETSSRPSDELPRRRTIKSGYAGARREGQLKNRPHSSSRRPQATLGPGGGATALCAAAEARCSGIGAKPTFGPAPAV